MGGLHAVADRLAPDVCIPDRFEAEASGRRDLVQGGEDMRTTVQTAVDLEKYIRGSTAGFNTPTFVVDAPGGGGKRGVHSYEAYDRKTGISVYTAPAVKKGQHFMYFDPVDQLSPEYQDRWRDERERKRMIDAALEKAQNDPH